MLSITERQVTALDTAARGRFAGSMQQALCHLPETAATAQGRPLAWFEWAVERAAQHRIDDQIDVCEFAAQLLMRGEALLDDPAARAGLDHPTNPAWLRVRHFAGFRLIFDREV